MKQNQARILIGVIILLVIAGLVFYFRNDLSKFIPSNNSSNNQNPNKERAEKVVRNKRGQIIDVKVRTKSEISGYEVRIKNEDQLVQTLIDWGVFGRTFGKSKEEVEKENLLSLINVILTDKKQPYLLEGNAENQLIASAGFELKGKEIDIRVYIEPNSLSQANNYFERVALRMMHGLVFPPVKGREQAVYDAFENYYKEKTANSITYFDVIKK